MRLSDIVGHLQLATFPIIGMLIFMAVFAVVIYRVLSRRKSDELDRGGLLPLDDGPVIQPQTTSSPENRS